jgi:hypothetical protein
MTCEVASCPSLPRGESPDQSMADVKITLVKIHRIPDAGRLVTMACATFRRVVLEPRGPAVASAVLFTRPLALGDVKLGTSPNLSSAGAACYARASGTTLLETRDPHANTVQLTTIELSYIENIIQPFPNRPPRFFLAFPSALVTDRHRSCLSSAQLHHSDIGAGSVYCPKAVSPHNLTGCQVLQRASRASSQASRRGVHVQLRRSLQRHRRPPKQRR